MTRGQLSPLIDSTNLSLLKYRTENSLVVQWLGLCALTVAGWGSILGWGTQILQAARCGKKLIIILKYLNKIKTVCLIHSTKIYGMLIFPGTVLMKEETRRSPCPGGHTA